MRLIFPETRHLRLQFEHMNETILIRIESDMIFRSWLYGCYSNYGKTEFWLTPHSHQSLHLIHQIFPNAKIRSKFMILCQPPLNGLLFLFPQPLLYKLPHSSIPRHKNPIFSPFLSSRKLSSLVISWSSWDSRYWVRLTLPLLTLLFLHP